MTENIVTGKHYRIMTDLTNSVWSRISFWKKASDVDLNSGCSFLTSCGSITGITDSLTSTSSTVCASSNAVKLLNDKLTALQS